MVLLFGRHLRSAPLASGRPHDTQERGEWYGFYVRRILFINRSLNTIKVHIINE